MRDCASQGIGGKGAGMFLKATWKVRQAGQTLFAAASLAFLSSGCTSGPEEARQARVSNQRMDTLEKCREKLARNDVASVVRSQSPPNNTPPTVTPVTNITLEPAPPRVEGEAQVRIVATIGTTPIYEREVREAVYQRLPEFVQLSAHDRKIKEKEMFNEELRRIIERELILDELLSVLTQKKQNAALTQLKDAASKDAEQRLRDIQKRAKLASDEDMKMFLQSQGLTMAGIKRHFERSFMMTAYLSERLKPKMNNISLVDLRDYYDEHTEEYKTDDRVKWQDIFIRVDRFRSKEDARKYSEWLRDRAAKGDDFLKLVNEFDQGDSKSREGMGYGEERGKIFPPELEQTVFGLKQGQVALVDFDSGFHIVRVAERTFAGKKPFDEQVQLEVRRKLQALVNEREYRKVVDTLWRRSQPQILVD